MQQPHPCSTAPRCCCCCCCRRRCVASVKAKRHLSRRLPEPPCNITVDRSITIYIYYEIVHAVTQYTVTRSAINQYTTNSPFIIHTSVHTSFICSNKTEHTIEKLEFGMYPQSMPTEWTHGRTVRPWQSVRLKKNCKPTPRSQGFVGQSSSKLTQV